MKKKLISFIVPMMLLCSCGDNNNVPYNGATTKKYEKEVTAEEFSTAQEQVMGSNALFAEGAEHSFKYSVEGGCKNNDSYEGEPLGNGNGQEALFYKESFNFDLNNKTAKKETTMKYKTTSVETNNSGNNSFNLNYETRYQMGALPGATEEALLEIYPNEQLAGQSSYKAEDGSLYSFFFNAAVSMCAEVAEILHVELPDRSENCKYYVDGNIYTVHDAIDNKVSGRKEHGMESKATYDYVTQFEFLENGLSIVCLLEEKKITTYYDDHYDATGSFTNEISYYQKFEISLDDSNIKPLDLSNYRFDD